MPENTSNEQFVEKPGTHTISRKPVLEPMPNNPVGEVDLGEVSTELTLEALTALAVQVFPEFMQGKEGQALKVDQATLQDLADFVSKHFNFKDNSLGMATVAKQLESYLLYPPDERAQHLDCKLSTVMMGLLSLQLGKATQEEVRVFLTANGKKFTPHPSLIIDVGDESQRTGSFLADAHLVKAEMPEGIQFENRWQRVKWERENSSSRMTVRSIEGRYGRDAVAARSIVEQLSAESLRDLDQAFLDA